MGGKASFSLGIICKIEGVANQMSQFIHHKEYEKSHLRVMSADRVVFSTVKYLLRCMIVGRETAQLLMLIRNLLHYYDRSSHRAGRCFLLWK